MDTIFVKVALVVLTYNRLDMLKQTLASVNRFALHYLDVIDNGSTDGATPEYVASIGGYCNKDGNHTTGHGMNIAITRAMDSKPDVIVFSADDYKYRPDWLARLQRFYENAPDEVKLASAHLEPLWSWNSIYAKGTAGGIPFVFRESLPGSNWIFRASDAGLIMPIAEQTGGEDLQICHRLRAAGHHLAALDLAEHIGEQQSAWGNESWRYAQPLNKADYGF